MRKSPDKPSHRKESREDRFVRLIEEGRRSAVRELPPDELTRRKLDMAFRFDGEMNRWTPKDCGVMKLPNDGSWGD